MKKKIDKNKVFWFIVILILVIVVFLMLFQSRYSIKKGQADNVLPSQIPTDLVEMTKTIIDAKEIYENASETEKPEIVSNLINIAEERQNKIYELLEEKNITEAKKQILDYDLISEIPEELKEFIEEPIDIEGTIEINHADYFEEGYFEEESFVITDKQESFKLRSIEDYEFLPKTSVRIKGVQVKDILLIDEDDESVDILDEPDNFNLPAQTNSTPTTIDSRKVAVILLNFANVQDDPPLTHEQVREIVFTGPLSANAYIKDVSFNQVEFIGDINTNGDVFGYYTLPYDNYPCKKAEWANKANQLATVNGFRYNNYDYVLYVVRSSTSCPGKASAAVLDKKSWYEELKSGYVNHELGHNFGLSHASLYRCKSGDEYVTLSESCTYKEYGDVFDTMGSSTGRRHFNAFFKTGFGNTQFIPYQNMITVTQTGTYTISSIENPTTNPQLLKIYRPNYPNLQKRQIYVDYREPHDVFDNYSTTSPAVNGIMIRLGPENNVYEKTYLLDAVPSTETANDAPFLVNQTFTDPYTGIQITLMEKTKSTATVYVDLNDNYQECVKYKPHAYFSLPRSLVGVAGNTFSYNLNVLNKNNSMCSNSDFNFNFNLPTGFTTTPIPTRSFYPGEMVTIPVQITTDPSLEGRYEFNVLVTDMSSGLSYTTFDASITLSMPSCTRKKPVVTITPKSQAGNLGDTLTYNLNVTNRDVSVCSTSDFLISASSLPSGFTITPIPEISIIPGSSVSIPVQITSGSSLVAGDYDFNISVKNKFSGLSETVIGTYQVSSTTYTLKYTSGSGGTLSGTTTQTVVKGGNGTPVTAIPNSSYHFVKWSDNSTQNPRTDTNVNNNITVVAKFEESKSSPPSGGGSGPTKSYPIVTNNSITTNIEIPSPENVQEILEDNNLSYDDINLEKYTLNNRNQYEIKRKLETTKTVLSSKKTEFLSKITLSVKNISDKNLTNLKVIEIIPKVIANSTSDINSTISFNVIKEDPIIEFDLSTLSSENTTEFTYSVNRQVTESQLNLIKTIISSGETNEELLESDENAHVSEDQNTEEIPEEKIEKIEESENSEEAETKNKKDSGWFIYLIIGLVVCIVIIILVFVFQRRKKDVINNPLQPEVVENPSSDMASQPEVTDNQSEVASQSEMIDNQPKIYNNENWSFFKTDEKTDKEN